MTDYALRVTSLDKGWTHDFTPAGVVFATDEAARRWASGFQRALGAEYRCALLSAGVIVMDCTKPAQAVGGDLFGAAHVPAREVTAP